MRRSARRTSGRRRRHRPGAAPAGCCPEKSGQRSASVVNNGVPGSWSPTAWRKRAPRASRSPRSSSVGSSGATLWVDVVAFMCDQGRRRAKSRTPAPPRSACRGPCGSSLRRRPGNHSTECSLRRSEGDGSCRGGRRTLFSHLGSRVLAGREGTGEVGLAEARAEIEVRDAEVVFVGYGITAPE